MVEQSVTERARQQGRRLQCMREHRRIGKGRLLDRLGFKTTQAYDLYERGTSVIRLDRVEDWADAFGIDVLLFLAEILGQREIVDVLPQSDDSPYSLRDDLRGELQEADINRLEDDFGGEDEAVRREVAKHARYLTAEQREATSPERSSRLA